MRTLECWREVILRSTTTKQQWNLRRCSDTMRLPAMAANSDSVAAAIVGEMGQGYLGSQV